MTSIDGWVAVTSALLSGVLVKVVDRVYAKTERRFDDAVAIRHELREEVRALHAELKAIQEELDRWKDRYYDLASRYHALVGECQALRDELKELQAHDDLRAYQQVQRMLAELRGAENPPVEGSGTA